MLTIRPANERGHRNQGWLNAYHSFSFGEYHDPQYNRFRSLRVMNEDWIAAGKGFGAHPHRDMEIVTLVLEGALEHKDSMGNGSVLRPGEFQHMTAGAGITHSEFNPSATDPVHLYQIWLQPESRGLKPSYEQRMFDEAGRDGRLQLVASQDAADGSLMIHQDVRVYMVQLHAEQVIRHDIEMERGIWIQVLRGDVGINGRLLHAGDGLAVEQEENLQMTSPTSAELLLFDMK